METNPKSHYGCFPQPDGSVVCIDPPFCTPPLTRACDARGDNCQCVPLPPGPPPRPKMVCEVRIQYVEDAPHAPEVGPMGPWCDGAGAELAVAVILARLLGAR